MLLVASVGGLGALLLFMALAYLKPHLILEIFSAFGDLVTKSE